MSDRIKLTWHGHSCFKIEAKGHSAVIDPYTGVPGYPELSLSAGEVYTSHDHDDHGWVRVVRIEDEPGESPFKVTTVDCFHDPEGGALRGGNKITVFEVLGKRIAHLGDLGHQLGEEQVKSIGACDVILLPVGGTYTVDAREAKQVADVLDPAVIIPMHYRTGRYGFDVIAEPEEFLRLCTDRRIIREDTAVWEVDDSGERRVVLLKFEA